jgi:hypothetical protein
VEDAHLLPSSRVILFLFFSLLLSSLSLSLSLSSDNFKILLINHYKNISNSLADKVTIDLFLDELKSQYQQEFELKSSLENKANYLLIAAGVTMSLLFSFGVELTGNLNKEYQYLSFVVGFLILGVVTNVISVLFSVLGFSIKPYRYTIHHESLFLKDPLNGNLSFNEKLIEEYRDGEGEEAVKKFKSTIIESYVTCILKNGIQNKSKAIKIKIAQWLFFAGAVSIPFIIGFALLYLWSKSNPS